MTMNKRGSRGFSLLELMIVVVVIAILTAVALPSYRQYTLRSHRVDAMQALQDLASREESYFFSNNTYTKDSTTALNWSAGAASNYFKIDVASASSTDYVLTATAIGTQTQDTACTSLSLDHAGRQTSTGTGTADTCWSRH